MAEESQISHRMVRRLRKHDDRNDVETMSPIRSDRFFRPVALVLDVGYDFAHSGISRALALPMHSTMSWVLPSVQGSSFSFPSVRVSQLLLPKSRQYFASKRH